MLIAAILLNQGHILELGFIFSFSLHKNSFEFVLNFALLAVLAYVTQ